MDGGQYEVSASLDALARECVNAAFSVHLALGPGLLESVYEACMFHELSAQGLSVGRQVTLPIQYRGQVIEEGFRVDLVVNEELIIEIKSVSELHPVYTAQLLTYLRLSDIRLGLLINFNTALIKHGIKRIINPPRPR
jgi:GxxExxY protein